MKNVVTLFIRSDEAFNRGLHREENVLLTLKMFRFAFASALLFYFVQSRSMPDDNTAVLISKYAKVAHWGINDTKSSATDIVSARNYNGHATYWPQRSEINNIGQNLKNHKPAVAYQYAVYKHTNDDKQNVLPAVGEVVMQDRFEPRPLFAYKKQHQISPTYLPPPSPNKENNKRPTPSPPLLPPAAPVSPPFDSFPVFNNPPSPPQDAASPQSEKPQQPMDLYSSPYSSYNPPPKDSSADIVQYSPNESYPPLQPSYAAPAPAPPPPPSKKDNKDAGKAPYPSLGPPYAPPEDNDDSTAPKEEESYPADDSPGHPPDDSPDHSDNDDSDLKHHYGGPPNYPPQSEDDIYYPPDDDGHHGGMKDQNAAPVDMGMGMMGTGMNGMAMNGMSMGMNTMNNGMMNNMGMHAPADFSPPAPDEAVHGNSFPHYLYDSHHYDHHVYEEIPHTTTTAAPVEEKRVSTAHYSYYYLGRKLWYIPLYFSIYFILYVTVLILKSIARHKIQFKYKWTDSRTSRNLNLDDRISAIHRNVSDGIESASRKYNMLAMK